MLISPLAAAEAPKCKLVRVAEWLLRNEYYRPVVDGAINGQKIRILLDTAAASSVIRRAAARRLELVPTQVAGQPDAESVHIHEFRIGKAVRNGWSLPVAGHQDVGDDVAIVLGNDFFQKADVEFDFQSNAVRVFRAMDCDGAPLAYWARTPLEVPLEPGDKVRLAIAINGKPVRALLDSGAGRSLLGVAEAARLGVTPESPGALPAGCVDGFGKNAVDSWTAQFESFAIGAEVIHNPRIRFGDLLQHAADAQAEMLLGADFLHSHRVLIARSQSKLYFTYAGGTVFARPPAARACGTPSR
jgi:predicted aspartyl protease